MSLNKIVIGLSVAALASMSTAFAQTTAEQTSLQVDNHRTPDGFSELSRTLMPSVVNISTSQRVIEAGLPEFPQGSPMERFNDLFGRDGDGFRRTSSLGSGFVIDETGFIVTNNHVIEGADEIEVSFADGRTYPAELVGRDADTDIAVLKIEPRAALPALSS